MLSPADGARLVRAPNLVLAAAGVVAGGWIALREPALPSPLLWASASAIGIGAAGNVLNDIFDLLADRVNRPERPLVRGVISVAAARWLALAAAAGGLVAARAAGRVVLLVGTGVLVVLVLYSPVLKVRGLLGNVTVATIAGLPLLYGALAAGDVAAGVIPLLLGAWLHLARELAKDADDAPGDHALGRRTVATSRGTDTARRWAAWAALAFLPASALPVVVGEYHARYLGFAAVCGVVVIWAALLLQRGEPGAPGALKVGMTVGLAGLVAGRL